MSCSRPQDAPMARLRVSDATEMDVTTRPGEVNSIVNMGASQAGVVGSTRQWEGRVEDGGGTTWWTEAVRRHGWRRRRTRERRWSDGQWTEAVRRDDDDGICMSWLVCASEMHVRSRPIIAMCVAIDPANQWEIANVDLDAVERVVILAHHLWMTCIKRTKRSKAKQMRS